MAGEIGVALAAVVLVVGLALLAYEFVGYPLVLLALALAGVGPDDPLPGPSPRYRPSVTMVVPAHNEAAVIERKLANVAATEYGGPFECLVVSDSTDGTDALVDEHAGPNTRLLSLPERRGKSAAVNAAVEAASGDVLVFSDANTMYDPDALARLVAPLADPAVGCVTGRLDLADESGRTTEGAYWRYELALRRLEARLGTTVSVNGGVLALRRDEFEPLPERALTDDHVLALRRALAGRRVVYAPDARATERPAGDLRGEYDRRVRIGAGNYQVLGWFRGLLDPRRGVVALQFASHKALRWLTPAVLAAVLAATLALLVLAPSPAVLAVAAAQGGCYAVALVGLASARARRHPLVAAPAYFLAMNLGFVAGFLAYLAGPTVRVWKPTR